MYSVGLQLGYFYLLVRFFCLRHFNWQDDSGLYLVGTYDVCLGQYVVSQYHPLATWYCFQPTPSDVANVGSRSETFVVACLASYTFLMLVFRMDSLRFVGFLSYVSFACSSVRVRLSPDTGGCLLDLGPSMVDSPALRLRC